MTHLGTIGRTVITLWLAAALTSPAWAMEVRRLRVTRVTWVDSAENTGTWLFQGTVDAAGALDGRVYPGDGSELIATGAVADGGYVSGSLSTAEEDLIGTFTAELNTEEELVGDLVIDGDVAAVWDAPAEDLPAN